MPVANVRGAALQYEVLGNSGPWVAVAPGGRRGLDSVKPLAQKIANGGYRVLIHDRRNCGASEITIGAKEPENELWADDLHELLRQLKALPAVVGGGSSGCRMALLLALRHPEAVSALLLWRITAGRYAAERLARQYYGQYIDAAEKGGMAAVCEMEHWKACLSARPAGRDLLMKMDTKRFIAAMADWSEYFVRGGDMPVLGVTEAQMRSIKIAACIIPGNDRTHRVEAGHTLAGLLPDSELHVLFPENLDVDVVSPEEWARTDDRTSAIFVKFLKRVLAPAASRA
jgi:pimeloyl-ACP methyl ester carboxylesterase